MTEIPEEKRLDDILDGYAGQMTADLVDLLAFESVLGESAPEAPFGVTIKQALTHVLSLAQKMGFCTEDHDGYVGVVDLGQSKDPQEMVGVLTHIDIVPLGEGWSHNPLGELDQGVIFGRGSEDDKGPMIACIYAMKALKESGLPLKKTIRHIIGTDEETGFRGIMKYLEDHIPPGTGFTPDAAFPLIYAEKGIAHFFLSKDFVPKKEKPLLEVKGGSAANIIPDRAGARLSLELGNEEKWRDIYAGFAAKADLALTKEEGAFIVRARGKGAHASLPAEGKNAIALLLKYLDSLSLPRDERTEYFHHIYQLAGRDLDGSGLGIAGGDEMGDLTIALTTIDIDSERGKAGFDVRFPVKSEGGPLKAKIAAAIAPYGLRLDDWHAKEPLYVPVDTPLVKALLQVYQDVSGDLLSRPAAIGGGTYARVMKDFVAFGPNPPGSPVLAHQAEENISVEHLLLLSKIYALALYRLAK